MLPSHILFPDTETIAGELARFHAGVTMEISRLDAWYSNDDGSLTSPATYIVRGLCRKCCLPEIILRCMQVGFCFDCLYCLNIGANLCSFFHFLKWDISSIILLVRFSSNFGSCFIALVLSFN